jgi:hypothetical protein
MSVQRLLPLTTTSHASLDYLVKAYQHYSPRDIRAVLRHAPSQPLLRTYGYQALYRSWLWAHSQLADGSEQDLVEQTVREQLQSTFVVVRSLLYDTN